MPLTLHQGGAPSGKAAPSATPPEPAAAAALEKLRGGIHPDSIVYVLTLHNGEVLEVHAREAAADVWLDEVLRALSDADALRAPAPDTPRWHPTITRGGSPQ